MPSHNNGNVILSGSNCFLRSMRVSAISTQVKNSAASVCSDTPKVSATTSEAIPVTSSTIGYWGEMLVAQEEHFALKNR